MTRSGTSLLSRSLVRTAAMAIAVAAPPALAVSYHSAFDLQNPTDRLFYAVSSAGSATHLVIGAPDATPFASGDQTGQVAVYDATTGALLHLLDDPMPKVPAASTEFGIAVAAIGSTVAVGAPATDMPLADDAGAVHVYDGNTGALQRTIGNPDPTSRLNFGWSLAVRGTDLVVGAPGSFPTIVSSGAVYVVDAASGATLSTFVPPVPPSGFGFAVAVAGPNLVVGAPYDSTLANEAGAAYLIDGTNGAIVHAFANPTPDALDHFGWSVGVAGNTVLVGAYSDDTAAVDAGAVYQFDATTGVLLRTFTEPVPAFDRGFGYAVTGLGADVVAGNYRGNRAYLFDASSGALRFTFTSPLVTDPEFSKYGFGSTLAAVGDRLLAGHPYDETGPHLGAAYLFDPCGNGVRTVREHCDDGNSVGGDGCPATCSFCEDGPDASCRPASSSALGIKRGDEPSKHQLKWKWKN